MTPQQWATDALQAFDTVVQATGGFRLREGQRRMAEAVAQAFSEAQLRTPEGEGKAPKADDAADPPTRAIAVVQAGTGVGKSLAYSVPAIQLALARGTRVLISTATVALQEQLVHKDLPALAKLLDTPFKYALAKGRGRFICKLKLERLASGRWPPKWPTPLPKPTWANPPRAKTAPPTLRWPPLSPSSKRAPAWANPWPTAPRPLPWPCSGARGW